MRAGVQDYEPFKTLLGIDTPYRIACFLNCHECGTEHALLWQSDEQSPQFLKRREPNITDIAPELLKRHLIRQTREQVAEILQRYGSEDPRAQRWDREWQKLSVKPRINLLPQKGEWKRAYQFFQENIVPLPLLILLPIIVINDISFYFAHRSYWARYSPAAKARAQRYKEEHERMCARLTEQFHKHLQAQLDDLMTEWDTLALPNISIPPPEQLFLPIPKPRWSYVGAILDHEPLPPRSPNPIAQLSCAVCHDSMTLMPKIDEDMPCPRCKAHALIIDILRMELSHT